MKQSAKQAIRLSFRRLLAAKPLDRITVRNIVEDCGLTRNTFYYHYEDIYDLFDDYLDDQLRTAWQSVPQDAPWDEVLVRMLSGVFGTPQMGRHIFLSRKRESMRLYLRGLIFSMLERQIEQEGRGLAPSAEDKRLICDTCSFALFGLLEQWLTQPASPPLETQLYRVARLFEDSLHRALLRACDQTKEDVR